MKTIPRLFEGSVAKYPNNVLVWEKKNGLYNGISFSEIKERVYRLAAGLMTLGVEKGDRVALLSEGSSEWLISELAILYLGAINIPLSVKINEPNELSFRIKHAGCRWVICSERQAEKVRNIKQDIPKVGTFIIIGRANTLEKVEKSYADVFKNGEKLLPGLKDKLIRLWQSVKPDDLANISYTSGTTADPKGIMLTHRNYTANVEQANTLMNVTEDFVTLLILPWDHSFAHTVGLYTLIRRSEEHTSELQSH